MQRRTEDGSCSTVEGTEPGVRAPGLGPAPYISSRLSSLLLYHPSDHRNPPSPTTERLAALARQSSRRQHPSQRWGLVYQSCLQLLWPNTYPESH